MERHAQALILKVRDYYYSERLYLLRCLKYMLSYWQEENHPYRVNTCTFCVLRNDSQFALAGFKRQNMKCKYTVYK